MELRIYILVRKDLKMSAGKIGAQCGHAVQHLILNGSKGLITDYVNSASPKIILKVDSLEQLEVIEKALQSQHITTVKIVDAGRTQIPENTVTVLGVGPISSTLVPAELSALKLY